MDRCRIVVYLITLLIGVMCVGVAHSDASSYPVIVERNVPVKMRDGVILHADICRPNAKGAFPVLLERTPYDKLRQEKLYFPTAAHGYIVIVQDVRGRYASQGEWYPLKHEADDGYDTVEWASRLLYSDGKVGMFGGSYNGATVMLAANASPPHLGAIFAEFTASNYRDGWTYRGGAFDQQLTELWTSLLTDDTFHRERTLRNNTVAGGLEQLPLASQPTLFLPPVASLAPYFQDWLDHPRDDAYWKRWSIGYPNIKVPAYCVAAWYDLFQAGPIRNYLGIRAHGGSEAARRETRLMIGVGGHSGGGRKVGDLDFGPTVRVDLQSVMMRWFDYVLKGVDNGLGKEEPVRVFVMGKDQWQSLDAWPPPGMHVTRYYLHSADGHANSLRGDGVLSTAAPLAEHPDHFIYDPADPVPTLGGGPLGFPGPKDQRPAEGRDDMLVYSTSAFRHDIELMGPVSVEIYAASSAVDTDFTAKLVDVWPNGYAQNLTSGILRARYRQSQKKAQVLQPGHVYKFAIDLWYTGDVVLPGHRLRVEISSSNFPRYDRNLNTSEDPEAGWRYVKADNTIYHDAEHPSALILPVVPPSAPFTKDEH